MWKTLGRTVLPIIKESITLSPESVLQQQFRTTYILKRRYPPLLQKAGNPPKRFRNKQYIYDLVKNTDIEKHQNIDVILTSYISGLGNVGDHISVKPYYAYNHLLLTGLAVYASPDNLVKYKDYEKKLDDVVHSSPTAQRTINCLSRVTLTVSMNKETPWTLELWHVKASFRKSGYHVPEEAIQLPKKPITGPNMDLQGKEFYVRVTVNNKETVNVRCVIHHWATDILERLPHKHEFWKEKNDPIFPEDDKVLSTLPSCPSNQPSVQQ